MTGTLGQTVAGIAVAGDLLYAAGSISGQIRVYDLATKAQVGRFETGSGGEVLDLVVTGSGDVWATDGTRPVLWHLTAQQAAEGSGTPSALPLTPEIAFTPGPHNLSGIVAVSDRRLLVVHEGDGGLYRIDLDPQAPRGRTITRVDGATVRQGEGMTLDGHRLVLADFHGLSIVELSDDAGRATAVTPIRDPAFNRTFSVARVADRYVAVNSSTGDGQPYVLVSVPVAG